MTAEHGLRGAAEPPAGNTSLKRRSDDYGMFFRGPHDHIVLRWFCTTCGWACDIEAPGYGGDGYFHYGDYNRACGPLLARRVGIDDRPLPPMLSDLERAAGGSE